MTLFSVLAAAASPTPSPTGSYITDENLVTPTWVGFTAIFVVAIIVILLAIDMVRRVRRLNYRAEIREKLEAERAAGVARTPEGE